MAMPGKRDEAFEAFYSSLDDKGGIGGRGLLRKAWEDGRLYEARRRIDLARMAIESYMHSDEAD